MVIVILCVALGVFLAYKRVKQFLMTRTAIQEACLLYTSDHEAYQKNAAQMDVGLYNLDTGEVEYFDKSYHEQDDILIKAACALLLLTKPVAFNHGTYMDGGLVDMIPIEPVSYTHLHPHSWQTHGITVQTRFPLSAH